MAADHRNNPLGPKHTSTGPRNRLLCGSARWLPPITGRHHPDRRHDLFQGSIGCLVLPMVVVPIVNFLGYGYLW